MNTALSAAILKSWKWFLVFATIVIIAYKVTFRETPVLIEPAHVGEIVAEVMGTGTLESTTKEQLAHRSRDRSLNCLSIKMTGLRAASCWLGLMTRTSNAR